MGAQNMMKLLMCIVIIAYARADDKIDTFVDEQYFPAEVETEFVEEMTEVTKKPCPRWCTNAKRRKHFLDTGVVKKEKDFVDPLCTWKKCFKCPGWLDKCPDLKVVKKGPASCAVSKTHCKSYAAQNGKKFKLLVRTKQQEANDGSPSCFLHGGAVYWNPRYNPFCTYLWWNHNCNTCTSAQPCLCPTGRNNERPSCGQYSKPFVACPPEH